VIGVAGVAYDPGPAAATDSCTARSAPPHGGVATGPDPCPAIADGTPVPSTWKTAPQTEQRARTPPAGTFVGSTRNTD
jgi:hypothetical protein